RDLLSWIDVLAIEVQASGRIVQREPRVMRRNVDTVLMQARRDTAVDNRAEAPAYRAAVGARVGAGIPAEAGHRHAAVERLQTGQLARRRVVGMLQPPAQMFDTELGIHRLVSSYHQLDAVDLRRGRRYRAASLGI